MTYEAISICWISGKRNKRTIKSESVQMCASTNYSGIDKLASLYFSVISLRMKAVGSGALRTPGSLDKSGFVLRLNTHRHQPTVNIFDLTFSIHSAAR